MECVLYSVATPDPSSSRNFARQHRTPMNCERRSEPRATELPDHGGNARIVRGLPDDATQV
jgi:hypothetical protein